MSRHNKKNDKWFKQLVKSGKLAVSKQGKVLNTSTGRYIGTTGSGGYPKISIQDPATKQIKSMQIHRLVWIIYRGLIPTGYIVNHVDGNKSNPRLSNLELITESANVQHALDNGLLIPFKGEKQAASKFTDDQVKRIRKRYAEANGKLKANKGAKFYGVSACTFNSMLKGRTYSHIKTGYEKKCESLLASSGSKTISKKLQSKIKELRLKKFTSSEIADTLGIARNTVMKYWK